MARRCGVPCAAPSSIRLGDNASVMECVGKQPGDDVTRNPRCLLSRCESRGWPPSTCARSATRAISVSNVAPIASGFANVLAQVGLAHTVDEPVAVADLIA